MKRRRSVYARPEIVPGRARQVWRQCLEPRLPGEASSGGIPGGELLGCSTQPQRAAYDRVLRPTKSGSIRYGLADAVTGPVGRGHTMPLSCRRSPTWMAPGTCAATATAKAGEDVRLRWSRAELFSRTTVPSAGATGGGPKRGLRPAGVRSWVPAAKTPHNFTLAKRRFSLNTRRPGPDVVFRAHSAAVTMGASHTSRGPAAVADTFSQRTLS
jgi:hypothetical protein